jgi:hypothetical protein
MKFPVTILLTALLAYAAGLYLPWWSTALSAFLVALLIYQRPGWAALSGFLGIFLLWGLMSWTLSSANGHILAHRMSKFILKKDDPGLLLGVTSLVGAITGALGGVTGSLARRAFKPVNTP